MVVVRERYCELYITAGYSRGRSNTAIEDLWKEVFFFSMARDEDM
jgi:hypothetical protein